MGIFLFWAGRLMAVTVFQVNIWFDDGFSFSPLGETGEGFVLKASKMSKPCPSNHHPRSKSHQGKTSTRKRIAARDDSSMGADARQEVGCPLSTPSVLRTPPPNSKFVELGGGWVGVGMTRS